MIWINEQSLEEVYITLFVAFYRYLKVDLLRFFALFSFYRLDSRTFFNKTYQISERYSAHMQAVMSEKN